MGRKSALMRGRKSREEEGGRQRERRVYRLCKYVQSSQHFVTIFIFVISFRKVVSPFVCTAYTTLHVRV